MVKSTSSEGSSPLEKWRRQKDKVLEADPVESPVESEDSTGDPAEDPPGGYKRPPAFPRAFPTMRGGSGDLTYLPIQPPSPKGEPTMVPIQSRPKGEATMMPGESRRQSAEATMVPIQSRPKGEATMMPGESRRPSAAPDMAPVQAPPPRGDAQFMETPGPSHDPSYESTQDDRAILESAINTFINELRSAATTLGMDFSIIQPDAMKLDFFTDSKALRVTFTGREQTIDRIVVWEMSPLANTAYTRGQSAGAGSARRQMLEWESGGMDAGQRNAKLDIATIRDANSGALDWNENDTPEEIEAIASASRIALEAHYFDADDGRNWLIELVNSQPAPEDETARRAPGPELTPEGARRLVMLLLNCLRAITRH